LETHKLHACSSGDGFGSQPKVPDEQEDKTTGIDEGTGASDDDDNDEVTKDDDEDDVKSDDDDDKEASDSEKMDSDEDENLNLNQNDDEEEEEIIRDVNVRLTDTEHKEQGKEDEETMDAGHDDTQQTKYKQVKDDEHVTLTTVHDTKNTEDFSSLFRFDQRVSALEKALSQLKQADCFAQQLETIKSQIPTMMDLTENKT
nr:hypothetical protein [Tanacetum cinerariifolium]